jgi:hypothetical protein
MNNIIYTNLTAYVNSQLAANSYSVTVNIHDKLISIVSYVPTISFDFDPELGEAHTITMLCANKELTYKCKLIGKEFSKSADTAMKQTLTYRILSDKKWYQFWK